MAIKSSWIDYIYIIAIGVLVTLFINDHINHLTEEESELKLMDLAIQNQNDLKEAQNEIVGNQKIIIASHEKILDVLTNSTK